jgi:adenosylhomocysteine nucleosidase
MPHPVKISLIMATLSEAKPFIRGMNLKQQQDKPFPVFSNDACVLTVCGIGKVNAAMATTFSCLMFPADAVVNLGAAGAVDRKSSLGEIFQISKIIEFDYPDLKTGHPAPLVPDTLAGFKNARIATQDHPVLSSEQRECVSRLADLADMEAAAVLRSCKRFSIKCLVYKFVSDTPKHPAAADIIAHIKKYRDVFFTFFLQNILPRL